MVSVLLSSCRYPINLCAIQCRQTLQQPADSLPAVPYRDEFQKKLSLRLQMILRQLNNVPVKKQRIVFGDK